MIAVAARWVKRERARLQLVFAKPCANRTRLGDFRTACPSRHERASRAVADVWRCPSRWHG